MEAPGVDWELIDARIPTAPTSSARAERDLLFSAMDSSGSGYITLSEAAGGLPPLLEDVVETELSGRAVYLVPVKDLRPAIAVAFRVAEGLAEAGGVAARGTRGRDAHIGRREFHALLLALRSYFELAVALGSACPEDGNGRLSWSECSRVSPLLDKWAVSLEQAKQRFLGNAEPSAPLAEFAQWCISERLGQSSLELDASGAEAAPAGASEDDAIEEVLKAFQNWDTSGSGTITADELACLLMALDASITRKQAMELFDAARVNEGGSIDYLKFTHWITQC